MAQKKPSKLVFSGPVSVQGDKPEESIKVGTLRLFEVHSDNEKAPELSGEVRIKDRIYRVAVWKAKEGQ